MPTISITKDFIIKDDKTLKKLAKIMKQPSKSPKVKTEHLKRGKELLKTLSF